MKKIRFVCMFLCCSLALKATEPVESIEEIHNFQKKGNELLTKQNENFKSNKLLIKDLLYLSKSEVKFLLEQRNKLIFNDIKMEALE